jgi:putative ABC transport system ATP-binding protein
MSTLELSNVSYTYKNAQNAAVADVSFVFETGSSYAIVGPSGSGKSTLLSLLAGLDLPTDGEVSFDGGSIKTLNLDRYRRECIAMIFQAFHLFPLLTAIENVCFPMEICGVASKDAKPRAMMLLESVGITNEQMKRFPSKLSGGEQQRVAIARSLASGARIILADEPTGNLDIANTKNIIEILHDLAHNKGYCVIIVTHDLEVAETADVVLRMKDGHVSGGCVDGAILLTRA